MEPIIFALGSTSPHKVEAAQAAFRRIGSWSGGHPELQLRTVAVASGVPPQPIGLDQTRLGAWLRAEAALRAAPEAQYAIGIESGIVNLGSVVEPFIDFAVVALMTRLPDGNATVYTTSVGVPVPVKLVRQSIDTQQQVEAGKFYAEEHGCDPTDMTSHLSRGVLSRADLIEQAVFAALACADLRTTP